ncbi:DUF6055 domain-containing protein [Saccharicrinis sp. FJH62]|uniref:DUF6055 domain-containing protein n=1 Tax=Saccharicrinis sp. FJH62 TaxID=3344657 RepID=UPI0035D41B69
MLINRSFLCSSVKRYQSVLAVLVFLISFVSCMNRPKSASDSQQAGLEKVLYIPEKVYGIPDSNDYENPESDFCFQHMVQSENVAIFWHKEYGDDPMANQDTTRRFDAQFALKECERFYDYYVNELKMVEKGHSVTDTFKLLVYVIGGDGGTAFGGGEEDKIGILWTPAVRINKAPYGALAHEMGHCFQYLSRAESGKGPRGAIMEMSAQYMLWHVYPEWMTFENYHLKDFMKGTHYAFLHPQNMYHSPYVLEYWSEKHGKEFFGELCRNTEKGEDPVMTYKRLNELTQEQFNDEIFDASRRFITWDLQRVKKVAHQYANQHFTKLVDDGDGWFRIDSANCPQNYGYNGIKLNVPEAGTKVELVFEGMAGTSGYSSVKPELAGWRYGFLASLENGKRVYGDMGQTASGKLTFKVPKHTEYLWLVVSGAPTEHWPLPMRWGRQKDETPDAQWPYKIKLNGTDPDKGMIL